VKLLRLAAGLPEVDRILVNPAIKRQLCDEVQGDRSWLRLMRPWYGHAAHMHIRFRCPADQPDCIQAAPPPPGDDSPFIFPPQPPYNPVDDPTARYAFLGTDPVTGGSFYASLPDYQNPSPGTHLYAGLLPDGRRLWVRRC